MLMAAVSAVIAALMVVLIRFLAAVIVWLIVVLASVGSLGALSMKTFFDHFCLIIVNEDFL